MNDSVRKIVKCQEPGDDSGDVIIDLPDDILESMNLRVGDFLTIESIAGSIVLKPACEADVER